MPTTTTGKKKKQWLLPSMASILLFVVYSIIYIVYTRLGKLHYTSTFLSMWEAPKLEPKTLLLNVLPRCTSPTNSSMWNYLDAMVDENVEMTNRVNHILFDHHRNHSSSFHARYETRGGGSDDDENKHRIPHLLIFTHKDDLFNCSLSTSNSTSMSPNLHALAENAKATVKSYYQIWPDVQYVFLSDNDCLDALNRTEPELIPFFNDGNLEGMFKADLCRAAYLVLHGGYYFDVDILVIQPYEAPKNASLVTVMSYGDKDFFQAFIAAEKGNAIILKSLRVMLEILRNERVSRGWLGPTALIEAWMEDLNVTEVSSEKNNGENGMYLLTECLLTDSNPPPSLSSKCKDLLSAVVPNNEMSSELLQRSPSGQGGLTCQDPPWDLCNYVVLDDSSNRGGQEQLHFYSRIVGTKYCGKACI